ncbi:MAG: TatD family hydrolase, partial [Steroidobacteraceae bacterium]
MESVALSPPELIDIGANLAHDSFDTDRSNVIERAQIVGVKHLLVTGSSIASTRAAIELSRQWPQTLRATAGIHPHHAADLDAAALDELRQLLAQPEVLAGGE